LCDKVQEIVDTFNLLSPESQSLLLECAYNILKAENSVKESVSFEPEHEKKITGRHQ